MGFTNHNDWMRETSSGGNRPSPLLKLDSVLEKLDDHSFTGALSRDDFLELSQAFYQWKDSEVGPSGRWESSKSGWKDSTAVQKLEKWIQDNDVSALEQQYKLEQADQAAHKAVADAIKQNTRTMFVGTKLTVKPHKALADINSVRKASKEFKDTADRIKGAISGATEPLLKDQVQKALASMFGDATAAQVLGQTFFSEIVSNVTPFVGTIKSGRTRNLQLGTGRQQPVQEPQDESGSEFICPRRSGGGVRGHSCNSRA